MNDEDKGIRFTEDPEESEDTEDYDHFIEELQRIIHEHPESSGMQAKFAKTILDLKEKKRLLEKTSQVDSKKDYLKLLESFDGELESEYTSSSDKFEKIMILTKLREKINEEKNKMK